MALARLRGFFVISRNSAFTYKGKPVNVQQVGLIAVVYLVGGVTGGSLFALLRRSYTGSRRN